jgi:DNA polymerase-3 subunit epsilon
VDFRWIGRSDDGSTVTLHRFDGDFSQATDAPDEWLEEHSARVGRGLVLDLETTGLEYQKNEIIEIGMRAFRFDKQTGEVLRVDGSYSALQDPGEPLSDEVSALTGITDEDLAGQAIDLARVREMILEANLVIAHNAGFDRPFLDRFMSRDEGADGRGWTQERIFWADSYSQVDWRGKGFPVSKLEVLALYHGFFVDAHRALADCDALLHLLSMEDANEGAPYLRELLQNARRAVAEVIAWETPFETKDLLKRRGYSWDAANKAWGRTVAIEALDEERAWLESDVYPGESRAEVRRVAHHDRFRAKER